MNLINANDRHMARMMCVMALKSSEDSSRRVARMHLAAAQQGKIQGRIAYGWTRTGPDKGKTFAPEAAVVRDIFAACLFGQTAYSTATDLNQRGIPSPTRRSWSSTMVNKILRNPRYAGMVAYGGKHRGDPTLDWDGWSHVLFDDDGHPLLGCDHSAVRGVVSSKPWIVGDDLWGLIEPLLSPWPEGARGPRPVDDRLCLQGILFVLHAGIA